MAEFTGILIDDRQSVVGGCIAYLLHALPPCFISCTYPKFPLGLIGPMKEIGAERLFLRLRVRRLHVDFDRQCSSRTGTNPLGIFLVLLLTPDSNAMFVHELGSVLACLMQVHFYWLKFVPANCVCTHSLNQAPMRSGIMVGFGVPAD